MANQVYLTGNISRDTKLVPTATGKPMAYLNVAAEREWESENGGTNRRTEFLSVVCFGDVADDAVRLGTKGRPIAVDGALRVNQREVDGTMRYDLEIVADAVHEPDSRAPWRIRREASAQPAASSEHAL